MRALRSALMLALALGTLSTALAQDDDPKTRDAKARIAFFDEHAGRSKDDQRYANLVMDLATFPHELTVQRIGKILLRDSNEERQMIAAAALAEFKAPPAVRDSAGKVLVKAIQDSMSDDVTDTCIDSVGKLEYRDAVPALCEVLLGGGNPYVLLTTVRVCARLDDRRALPALLELWERNPVGYSWQTGEVKVDTGASGTTDQDAAEAAWNAKYGKVMKGKGKPPVMFKVYIQEVVKAVRKITRDEKIETPEQLRAWMEARSEELRKEGVEIPKKKGATKKPNEGKDGKKVGKKDEKDEKDEPKDGDAKR